MNYARRQQYRRLSKAVIVAVASAAAGLMALALASVGAMSFARVLVIAAVAFGLYARRWFRLAERSRVGARSEDEVRRALEPLRAEGWRVRHSLPWQGPGDIDSVAIAPSGVAIVIETKTRTYHDGHLSRVLEQAAWLSHRQRRWWRNGVLAIVCLVRLRGVKQVEADVIVVSIDRLTTMLRSAAEVMQRDVCLRLTVALGIAAVIPRCRRASAARPTSALRTSAPTSASARGCRKIGAVWGV